MFLRMTKPKSGKMSKGLVFFLFLFLVIPAKSFAADKTPPSGSIKINNNSSYTSSTNVTLNLSASDKGSGMGKGAKMRFANSSWSSPENYKTSKSWSLTSGDGTKTVYAKFCDAKGNWMKSASSDTIILDTSKPAQPSVSDSGSTTSSTSSLYASWSASDTTSGIAEYQYQLTQDSSAGTVIVSWTSAGTSASVTKTSLSLTSGKSYYFGVKAKNGAGLWSDVGYSDGISISSGSGGSSDTTIPNISKVSPEDKSFVYQGKSQTLSITTGDSDSYQNYYQFSIDGSIKQSWSTKSSYSWNTSSYSLKKYTLKFEAKDDGGSSSKESKIFLIKEPVSPPD